MLSPSLASVGCWLLSLVLFTGASPLDSNLVVHPAAGQTESEVLHLVRHELHNAAVVKRDYNWKGNTTINRSWSNAPLLELGVTYDTSSNVSKVSVTADAQVICTDCYIKGTAFGELSIKDNNFNLSQTISNVTSQFETNIKNLTEEATDVLKDYVEEIGHDLITFDWDDIDDVEFPTFNYTFDLAIPPLPEANLHFTFDGLELYMQIDTILSLGATYTISLFDSARDTPEALVGWGISDNLKLGLIFKMDLILAVNGSIDISSGFHLKLNDGFAIDIALFGEEVSDITYNGGHFEFLPVQIESAGITFSAILQLSIHAGIKLQNDNSESGPFSLPAFGGGVDVGVFANLAEFITDVKAEPNNPECEVELAQSYVFAIGAQAGATMFLDTETWGPTPNTSIAVYTAAVSTCVEQGSSAAATTTGLLAQITSVIPEKRQDLSTATITTTQTFTGVNCKSTGLVNCPVSLQNTSQSTTTRTTTMLVPSGIDTDDLKWPPSLQSIVTSTIDFGTNAIKVPTTAGSPIPYTAPPTPTSTSSDGGLSSALEGNVGGVPKKTIVGLGVGLGVPVLFALVLGIILCRKRHVRGRRIGVAAQSEIEDEVEHHAVETKHERGTMSGKPEAEKVVRLSRYQG